MISVERVRATWHKAAYFPANKEVVYPEHAQVQEFDQHCDQRVLEYGCGGGSDAMSYLRRECTVWYVDIVPANVEMARRRIEQASLGQRAYGLVIDESAKVPIVSRYFDLVNCHGVLHHIEDPVPVLREFHRLLKPEGLLYLMLYTEHLWAQHEPMVREFMEGRHLPQAEAFGWCTDGEGTPYARAYTEEEGHHLLVENRFKVLSAALYNGNAFRTYKARAV